MYFSPLRYPGGKAKLSEWFTTLMRANRISGGSYVEPYAGGAGVALHLLIKGVVNHIQINDFDVGIYLFWRHVVDAPAALIAKIQMTPVTIDEWHRQRDVLKNPQNYSELDIAYSSFFLNRTNRSGIIKGGVIGGLTQQGNYKIDARFNKDKLCNRIQLIARFRQVMKVTNLDCSVLLDELIDCNNPRSLVYLDPPYYKQGKGLYLNAYKDIDHVLIADKLKALKTPWVLTYDNHTRIHELYKWTQKHHKDVRYSANERRLEKELVFCGNIKLLENPIQEQFKDAA